LRAELDPLARHPHVIAMDIVELMHALENAFTHAYPGREAAERDAVMRELRRLVEAHERGPRPALTPIRLRLVRD
jgi:hypothetical protein